jgi:hypothetical protein
MILKSRVVFEVVNASNGDVISRDELINIDIERPKTIDQIGLETSLQQQLVQSTADKLIELQGPLINEHKTCPKCEHKVTRSGKTTCEIHSLNSEHVIEIQKYKCPICYWTSSDSIKKMYGTDVHTSLTKVQAELGSNYSYRKVVSILKLLSFEKERPVNNKERIKRVLTEVGDIISAHNLEEVTDVGSKASNLIVHVDGAHVSSMEKDKRSFEVMTGTIYRPEDVKVVNENENIIFKKICVASAKEDKQNSMKIMLINAAKTAGMHAATRVTAFSDGASNCKSVIRALSNHCDNLEIILDWFYIAMKFQNITPALPEDLQEMMKGAKWKLWHGLQEECLEKLAICIEKIEDDELKKRTTKLVQYLKNNSDVLINYEERKNSNRPFTSNVAESTVENLVNSRCGQTGKMKWLRDGAHALLQIRCAHYSKSFNKIWGYVVPKLLPQIPA